MSAVGPGMSKNAAVEAFLHGRSYWRRSRAQRDSPDLGVPACWCPKGEHFHTDCVAAHRKVQARPGKAPKGPTGTVARNGVPLIRSNLVRGTSRARLL